MGAHVSDAYGRPLDNLRIAVTRECNYRCFFCHIEGDPSGGPARIGTSPPQLKSDDYYVVAAAAGRLGIRAFKITGGEPLVRSDIASIISNIRDASGPDADISMTTNGYLLSAYAKALYDSGLRRVNVSLHSLDREHYKIITGVDGLDRVIDGIERALDVGLKVKVNVTVTKVNVNDVWDIIDFASSRGVAVQLIELQPVNEGLRVFKDMHVDLSYLESKLKEYSSKVVLRPLHNRPIYILKNGVTVEVVKPFNNPLFCAGCRRVRLLSDGRLTPCINYMGPGVNILRVLREARTKEEAIDGVVKALIKVNQLRKPFYMWPLGGDGHTLTSYNVAGRLALPKKVMSMATTPAGPTALPREVPLGEQTGKQL
ncbi:Probable molybdenum cofactor biosynthesis protein A [Acidilobus saccharovorans 345-15]|uniref:Probable GTP 3',8-cyclase n=1 Tax=Acidilobus saccharovorans (strain DSM 16705 / JCM 18335 / VKM B-2471 / 345-15) TaxID=666510 RepID=D9Q286_ACIS3|nr:GTP 3',8-cyclase MoaA [Acidilobus saccharovorans]ADL19424.1 Probable molybdenum cofactor biosynthesis protein A [Acidilobus saccharovorans 345-15]